MRSGDRSSTSTTNFSGGGRHLRETLVERGDGKKSNAGWTEDANGTLETAEAMAHGCGCDGSDEPSGCGKSHWRGR